MVCKCRASTCHTQVRKAMCLNRKVCDPAAFLTPPAQLSGIIAPSASLALIAATKIKVDLDFFQGHGTLHFTLAAQGPLYLLESKDNS